MWVHCSLCCLYVKTLTVVLRSYLYKDRKMLYDSPYDNYPFGPYSRSEREQHHALTAILTQLSTILFLSCRLFFLRNNVMNKRKMCLLKGQLKARHFLIGVLLSLCSVLWSGCCLFYTFPVSVLVFIGLQIESYIILEDSITVLFLFL